MYISSIQTVIGQELLLVPVKLFHSHLCIMPHVEASVCYASRQWFSVWDWSVAAADVYLHDLELWQLYTLAP